MNKLLEGQVTISRDNQNIVCIEVKDTLSRITFVKLKLTLEEYAKVITGLSYQDCQMEVKGLEYVGKEKITEARSVYYPDFDGKKAKMQNFLEQQHIDDGWLVNTYLGGQTSISPCRDGRDGSMLSPCRDGRDGSMLNYSVYKYVEVSNEEV